MSDADQRLREAIGPWPETSAETKAVEERWQVPTYKKLDVAAVRGAGCHVWDAEGNRYLDLYGGHAVALAGHGHPRIVKAIQAQAERLLFYSNLVHSDVRAVAAERLAALAPEGLRRVFLCNSGTEANETALKIARKHTGRRVVVSMVGGFHGRTMGALAATGIEGYRDPAYPLPEGAHRHVPFGDIDAADAAIDGDTAAVLLEPIPSMGGIRLPEAAYLDGLRRRCTERGAFLVFDEVQTGFGRTGVPFFGAQGVVPDLITGAKGIASGFPAGVVYVREDVAANMAFGEQGTTFGGGPLACAAIAANLAVLEDEDLAANALAREADVRALVGPIPGVREVSGRGLLLGLDLDREAAPVVRALRERHRILAGTCGGDARQVRLLPPLVLGRAHVEELAAALRDVLA